MQRLASISLKRILLNTFCILSGIAIGFVVLALAGLIEVKDSWPAWVQAIGSVAAIGVAIAVPAEEAARRARSEDAARVARIGRAAAILHPTLTELARQLFNFIQAFGQAQSESDPDLDFYSVDSDFEALMPILVSTLVANEDLGELGPDVYALTVALSDYDGWIKSLIDVMAIGHNNHLLRTEIPERVRRAGELLELTGTILRRISKKDF